jgi:hypothetical protein
MSPALRAKGTLIVLQPNIRYLPGRYWDYLDHHIALSHLSMLEALELAGFHPVEVVPKFLPYTVEDRRLPRSGLLVRAYLKLRPAWAIFGRQMLIVSVLRLAIAVAGQPALKDTVPTSARQPCASRLISSRATCPREHGNSRRSG